MKLVTVRDLVANGSFPNSQASRQVFRDLRAAIDAVRWPPGAPDFTIYGQRGKRRGQGNGVTPIKQGFVAKLREPGWRLETDFPASEAVKNDRSVARPGAFDAWNDLNTYGYAPFVAEWETGNISSSHRALNKMALGLLSGQLAGGVLIVPTRTLYQYLTDRVGNDRELEPYFPLWSALPIKDGYLGVIAVEHDAVSMDVPRITKGTDGRALL